MPEYVDGLDLSHHQGIFHYPTAISRNIKYFFVRAGSIDRITLIPYSDWQFGRNSIEAPKYAPTGFYWYFRPTRAILQADYLYNLIRNKDWKLPLVVDVETNLLWSSNGDVAVSMKAMADQVELFVNRIKTLIGAYPILYTRMSFWTPYVEKRALWSQLHLWVARYSSFLTSPWSDGLYPPRDWADYTFWQWSADKNGMGAYYGAQSDDIDLDRFNGNEFDFIKYVGIELPPLEETALLRDKLNRYDQLISSGILTGSNTTGAAVIVPNLPAGAQGVIVRLISTATVKGAYVAVGTGTSGNSRFKVDTRQQVACEDVNDPLKAEPYFPAQGDVMLDGDKIYLQWDARGGTIKYFLYIQGYKVADV